MVADDFAVPVPKILLLKLILPLAVGAAAATDENIASTTIITGTIVKINFFISFTSESIVFD